jgi:phosphonate transport system permease protein
MEIIEKPLAPKTTDDRRPTTATPAAVPEPPGRFSLRFFITLGFLALILAAFFLLPQTYALILLAVLLIIAPFIWKQWQPVAVAIILGALIWSHVYGWEKSQVDPFLLARKLPDMERIVGQLVQPDIITRDEHQIVVQNPNIAGADKPVESAEPSTVTQEVAPTIKVGNQFQGVALDEPTYETTLTVSPATVGPGQTITVSGSSFRPNSSGEIVWQFPGTNSFPKTIGAFTADATGKFSVQAIVPDDPSQVVTTFPNTISVIQTWDVGSPHLSDTFWLVLDKIIETIFLALMGTTFAVVLSIPLSFLASHNLMANNVVGTAVYVVARTILNILRSVEVLIMAVIFAASVGIGPFAGVLALALHSIASLGKLYSEAIESIDPGPIEAITATGANRLQVIMYAVVPQFIPQFISFTLYRWDINVRMSTVIGFVGGGGIGYILIQYINLLQWHQAGTAIVFIAIVVILMDWASARIRAAVI